MHVMRRELPFCTEKRVKCRGWHVIYIKDINDLLLTAGE